MPVTFVELGVDRTTFIQWSNMLSGLRQMYSVPLQYVGTVSGLTSPPQTLQFTGLDLLLDIGRACTRPEINDDPERLFAIFRYATKISSSMSSNNPNLRLVSQVADMDIHKKKVLSDEFGCGFAFIVARRLFNADIFLDTFTAMRLGILNTSSPRSQQPDYFSVSLAGAKALIIEAKGTQSNNYCLSQIAKGCNQVKAVNLPSINSAIRVVIGAELRREDHSSDTTIFIGDPDEIEGHEYDFNIPLSEAIVRCHYIRVASLIGDAEMLHKLENFDNRDRSYKHKTEHHLETQTLEKRKYVGSKFQFRSGASNAGFFIGIDDEIRHHILESNNCESFLDISKKQIDSQKPQRPDGTILHFWSENSKVS